MPQRCKFKTGTTLDIKHTNPMPPKNFQDAFRLYNLDHQISTKVRSKLYKLWKIKQYMQAINTEYLLHTQQGK